MSSSARVPLHRKDNIWEASKRGDADVVLQFLKTDPSLVSSPFDHDNTPLHLAALNGHTEIIDLLLEAKGNTRLSNKWGNLPVHCAAGNGHLKSVLVLIQHAPDTLEAEGINGCTPLIMSAGNGHYDCTDGLLQLGADIHHADKDGDTPLHYSAMMGKGRTSKLLVQLGASINRKNSQGKAVDEVAKDEKVVQALFDSKSVNPPENRVNIDLNKDIQFDAKVMASRRAELRRSSGMKAFEKSPLDDIGEMEIKTVTKD